MPKIYLSKEERDCQHFCDFVRRELRVQKKKRSDLADELGLPLSSVTQRINGNARWNLSEIITTLYFLNTSYEFGDNR